MSRALRWARVGTVVGLLALMALCIGWEAWWAPLRPGSLMWLKALPLLLPLAGVLRGRRYTYQWLAMFVLAWFIEGVMRAWGDHGLSQRLAGVEVALSVWVCIGSIVFARLSRPLAGAVA